MTSSSAATVKIEALDRVIAAVTNVELRDLKQHGSALLCLTRRRPEIGVAYVLIVLNAARRAVIDQAAEVQHDRPVAEIVHERHVVLDDQQRQTVPGDGLEERGQFGGLARIQARRRARRASAGADGSSGRGRPRFSCAGRRAGP